MPGAQLSQFVENVLGIFRSSGMTQIDVNVEWFLLGKPIEHQPATFVIRSSNPPD